MKNLVMVLRLKDNAKRLYALPDELVIPKGTILEVEFVGGTALGVAVTDNHQLDDEQEALTREFLHVNPNAEYRKVVNVLIRDAVKWPDADAADDEDADATDDEDADEDDTAQDDEDDAE